MSEMSWSTYSERELEKIQAYSFQPTPSNNSPAFSRKSFKVIEATYTLSHTLLYIYNVGSATALLLCSFFGGR